MGRGPVDEPPARKPKGDGGVNADGRPVGQVIAREVRVGGRNALPASEEEGPGMPSVIPAIAPLRILARHGRAVARD